MNDIMQAAKTIEALKNSVVDARDEEIRFEYTEPFLEVLLRHNELEVPDDLKRTVVGNLQPLFGNSADTTRLVDFVACQMVVEPYRKKFALEFEQDRWLKNCCPFCGNSAGLAYFEEEGMRKLVCHFCWTDWKYARGVCAFCDHESDEYSLFEVDDTDVRLDKCENCNQYLKTSISGVPESFAGFDIKTLFLDEWAQGKGLKKPGPSLIGIHFFN
jgi:formate dehydrogenase maturation protein FdhE